MNALIAVGTLFAIVNSNLSGLYFTSGGEYGIDVLRLNDDHGRISGKLVRLRGDPVKHQIASRESPVVGEVMDNNHFRLRFVGTTCTGYTVISLGEVPALKLKCNIRGTMVPWAFVQTTDQELTKQTKDLRERIGS